MASPKKIVIIGGGMSGLAAAFGLTSAPNWQQQYEITVLQLGWRLGGKGASGRNQNLQQKIEEHGLHIWGGFYENAFRVIRACYTEMDRPPTMPLATWDEAFKPCPLVNWMEDLNSGWLAWNNAFPEYSSTPGDGTPMPSIFKGILRVLEWIIQTAASPNFASSPTAVAESQSASHFANSNKPSWVSSVIAKAEASFDPDDVCHPALGPVLADTGHPSAVQFLIQAYKVLKTAPPDPKNHPKEVHEAASWLLDAFRTSFQRLTADADPSDNGIRQALILVDLGIAEVVGILNDGVLANGFNCIDDQDLMAWFAQNGALPESANSALVRGTYDFIFGYENGDPAKPALGAGAGLRYIFRLIMWYKGAIFWKMQAGVGDTVFAPLYQVLQNRGVNFRFFQKVQNLGLDPTRSFIQTIDVGEQATPASGRYQPLYDVNNLPCWPNEPFFSQLAQGQQLQQQGIDLEDPWADWSPVNTYTLQAGQDFDTVILATSFAQLSEICTELIAANTDWANMVQNIQTVPTQYRMKPAGSGFSNLYLAGDWTLNGLNFGCIESAAMGGLEVSQAICGYPQEIVGESDF